MKMIVLWYGKEFEFRLNWGKENLFSIFFPLRLIEFAMTVCEIRCF